MLEVVRYLYIHSEPGVILSMSSAKKPSEQQRGLMRFQPADHAVDLRIPLRPREYVSIYS